MELTWNQLTLRQAVPFRTSKAIRTDKQTLLVRLERDGIVGLGEASPTDTYHQTVESGEIALAAIRPLLRDRNPFHLESTMAELVERFPGQLATVAAVDAAMHDWIGKRLGISVVNLLGLDERRLPLTSYSIGMDSPDEVAKRAEQASVYPVFKVKVGGANDLEMLAAIRRVAPRKPLRIDANGAWSVDQAVDAIQRMAEFNIEFVEQPLAAGDIDGLEKLTRSTTTPIVLDESCVLPGDIKYVAGKAAGINIKLGKCGGIRESMKMIRIAQASGLKIMLGCMIESALGIAAAAQLAPLADWLDLDGHLLLADGPFDGLGGAGGRLTPGGSPGLGVYPTIPL